jgi:hypothetical protein
MPTRRRSVRTILAVLAVLLLAASGCLGDSSSGLRISRSQLVRQVRHANHGALTVCNRHAKDGSHWGCLVGDPPDPECYVIDVAQDGSWKIEDQPRLCHYP